MKIQVWQQFSSNHSAAFTVVGKFPSPLEAQQAAEKIRAILQEIERWWHSYGALDDWWNRIELGEMTPIEQELAQKYSVEWGHGLNWFIWDWNREKSPVSIYREFVFVENPHPYIRSGPQPFNGLLRVFGAGEVRAYVGESGTHSDTLMLCGITFTAPDETTAITIADAAKRYLEGEDADYQENLPPWIDYYGGHMTMKSKTLRKLIRIYYKELNIRLGKHTNNPISRLTKEQNQWLNQVLTNTVIANRAFDLPGTMNCVEREGLIVKFNGLFCETCDSWVEPIRAIVAWLEAHHCSQIGIQFAEIPNP